MNKYEVIKRIYIFGTIVYVCMFCFNSMIFENIAEYDLDIYIIFMNIFHGNVIEK